MKVCKHCTITKPLSEFGATKRKLVSGADRLYYRSECKECSRIAARKWNKKHRVRCNINRRAWSTKLKLEVLKAYGNKCECCGEDEPLFLAIDHINGGGRQERLSMKRESSKSFYIYLRQENYPDKYRILCHNCNVGRHINGGICPHQAKETNSAKT